MAGKRSKPPTQTAPCPECGGAGVVPGARYTEPARRCETCKGGGTVEVKQEPDGADA